MRFLIKTGYCKTTMTGGVNFCFKGRKVKKTTLELTG